MSDWQPIETAPKDGERVLLFAPEGSIPSHMGLDGVFAGMYDSEARGWMDCGCEPWPCEPTHWQPIPEPPQ